MTKVVGVSFKEKGRIYYFLPNKLNIKMGDNVIVKTERGLQYGLVETDYIELDIEKLKSPLKEIVRLASKEDGVKDKKNRDDALKAIKEAKNVVKNLNLDMNIIDASYTFDRDQLLFRFLADNRIDFRNLAKELASLYRTRIELRQVGVRDKSREIGGLGMCGRCLCCSSYNYDFDTVSINMAKNQGIALNPSKINGICGRLLCCLKYEDETYKECRKCLPELGKFVETEKGKGKVINVDILKKKYSVSIPDVGVIEVACNGQNN